MPKWVDTIICLVFLVFVCVVLIMAMPNIVANSTATTVAAPAEPRTGEVACEYRINSGLSVYTFEAAFTNKSNYAVALTEVYAEGYDKDDWQFRIDMGKGPLTLKPGERHVCWAEYPAGRLRGGVKSTRVYWKATYLPIGK